MACRGFWECLLKLLNFLLTLAGLAMVGYGIYLFVEWERSMANANVVVSDGAQMVMLGRPLLGSVPFSASFLDNLPKACSETLLQICEDIGLPKWHATVEDGL